MIMRIALIFPDCPKECFRAKLVRDLDKRHLDRIRISWATFKGTEECMRKGERDEGVFSK